MNYSRTKIMEVTGMSLTDKEMRERLELLGYDLTNTEGNYSVSIMSEIASLTEGYKWDEEKEVWLI